MQMLKDHYAWMDHHHLQSSITSLIVKRGNPATQTTERYQNYVHYLLNQKPVDWSDIIKSTASLWSQLYLPCLL